MKDIPMAERKRIVQVVFEGKKSEYWDVLRGQLVEWISDEHRIMDGFKRTGIRTEKDREIYNRALDRLEYLKRLANVNESIIEYNRSFLEKIKDNTNELYKMTESFVKEIFE